MSTTRVRERRSWRSRLLLENWTLLDPAEMRARRAAWPAWRRAIRPVGLVVYGAGIVLGWFYPWFDSPRPWSASAYFDGSMVGVLAVCILVGTGLEWRDRHIEGRTIFGHPRRGPATPA